MDGVLMVTGRVFGVVGLVICAVAIVGRLSGAYWLGGFQIGTLFQAGIAAMTAGCLCFLWVLAARSMARP